jgi:hypothetical protein
MLLRITYILILGLISILSFAQQLKKKTEIVFTYGDTLLIDTTVTEYNREGLPINDSKNYADRFVFPIDTFDIDTSANLLQMRIMLSDSSIQEYRLYDFQDSVITISLSSAQDTLSTYKVYYSEGNCIKTAIKSFPLQAYPHTEIVLYEQDNFWQTKKTRITAFGKTESTDTVKTVYNKLFKIRKELEYNPIKQEWFVRTKTKYRKNSLTVWETFYHDYHKMYFTTITKTKYNKHFLPIKETIYDARFRWRAECEKIFEYEFYEEENPFRKE